MTWMKCDVEMWALTDKLVINHPKKLKWDFISFRNYFPTYYNIVVLYSNNIFILTEPQTSIRWKYSSKP